MPYRKRGISSKKIDRSKCTHEWGKPEDREDDWSWTKRTTTNAEGHTLTTWRTSGSGTRFCTKCRKRQYQWYTINHEVWRDTAGQIMSEKHDKEWSRYTHRIW